jgi:hypothetical protein
MTKGAWFHEETITTPQQLLKVLISLPTGWIGDNRGGTWIYRGQTNANWPLETTFDRARKAFSTKKRTNEDCVNEEILLVRRFKRQAHLYMTCPPALDAHLEWRALLRHHYGPTRLMDWTYSAFIAAFFALCDTHGSGNDSVLWAIRKNWLWECEERYLKAIGLNPELADFDNPATFRKVFLKYHPRTDGLVIAANPYCQNERLQLQQGLFLIPLRMDISFEENLKKMASRSAQQKDPPIKKFVLKANAEMIENSLRYFRKMNITIASLFPGLDGYARSLNHWPLFEYNAKDIAIKRELMPKEKFHSI